MNIQNHLLETEKKIGIDKLCNEIKIHKRIVVQFLNGKKKPSLNTLNRIKQLWPYDQKEIKNEESKKEVVQEVISNKIIESEISKAVNGEHSEVKQWEEDGSSNFSFVPRGQWDERWKASPPWEGKDICLCLPMYKTVPQETVISFIALAMRYKEMIRIEQRGGDSMITRSRNQLARRFLKTGASWSIWLDDDMIFPIGNAGIFGTWMDDRSLPHNVANHHVLERLISWKKTIVGGCYWDRKGQGRLICGGSTPILNPIPSDALYPANFIGTGCLAIHRSVFEDIAKKFPETMSEESWGNECGFFTNIQTENRMLGEDESFGWRAKEAGHPSYLDLGLVCGHIGTVVHGMPKTGTRI